MIAIVDYGIGNLTSIAKVFRKLRIPARISSDPAELARATKYVLPGVGQFSTCMAELDCSGLVPVLEDQVLRGGKALLGICVGMQLLGRCSEEGGGAGLGWIAAQTIRLPAEVGGKAYQVPHIGWNVVTDVSGPLFAGLESGSRFYFMHSFAVTCDEPGMVIAKAEYGISFTAAIASGNLFGTQFHPEKSHGSGVRLLQNFSELC